MSSKTEYIDHIINEHTDLSKEILVIRYDNKIIDKLTIFNDKRICKISHINGIQGFLYDKYHEFINNKISIGIASNAGRPGGSCLNIKTNKLIESQIHASHKTQEESIIYSWLGKMYHKYKYGANYIFMNTISKIWGLNMNTDTMTKQGIDYTIQNKDPSIYNLSYTVQNTTLYIFDQNIKVNLVFTFAPNTVARGRDNTSTMTRTLDPDSINIQYSELGLIFCLRSIIQSAIKTESQIVIIPYIGCGIYTTAENRIIFKNNYVRYLSTILQELDPDDIHIKYIYLIEKI